MSLGELDDRSETLPQGRCWRRRGCIIIAVTSLIAGSVGYAVASTLASSTTCATGRSPITFALLLGFTAALAAASGLRMQR
jgi:hypothetical protein